MKTPDCIEPRSARATSGNQFELHYEDQSATIVEVGATLRRYERDGRPLIDGFDINERATGARGQTFVPWPNRLKDGCYSFAGYMHQLPISEPAHHNAIHGLVRWANWSMCELEANRVMLAHTLYPQAGWPFALELTLSFSLGANGLTVATTAVNVGAQTCPYGTGAHPYLTTGAASVDQLLLKSPGRRWLQLDRRGIPIAEQSVFGTDFDFRSARPIGPQLLDTAFTDLVRDEEGKAHVEITDESEDGAVGLWMDRTYDYLMLFTGDTLAEPRRRRRGLGVEPMTCAPNALRSNAGLQRIEPGASFTSRWGIARAPSATATTTAGRDASHGMGVT